MTRERDVNMTMPSRVEDSLQAAERKMQPTSGRRHFLQMACGVVGGSAWYGGWPRAARTDDSGPLSPRPAHHEPRARNLIFIFLTGGFSHVDTFDPKPELARRDGQDVPAKQLRGTFRHPLMGSPFSFKRYGQSGIWCSELFPQLGSVADELCVIRSLHTDIVEHFQAVLAMHTGSATVPMPSLGAWISYGLGTPNGNLPSYVVMAERLPYAGSQVFDNGFLPPEHQGVRVVPGNEPIPNLAPTVPSKRLHDLEQRLLREANIRHAEARDKDPVLRARTASFGTARGMMRTAPEAMDVRHESSAVRALYGVGENDKQSFAWQCLVSRRLVERGVRVVELIDTGSNANWDSHGNMLDHRPKARRVDQPIAALIKDLRQRGLLDETLIAICTEFGRTPWSDNAKGRNHYAAAFSSLLAGAGVRGGTTYGTTDELGMEIVDEPCHVHDYHATILHLMGIDHTRLTYRFAGRDFRLTDVYGRVLERILT